MPSLFISILMGIVVYFIKIFRMAALQTMVLQIIIGIIIYISLAKIFKIESFEYLTMTIKEMLKNKKE